MTRVIHLAARLATVLAAMAIALAAPGLTARAFADDAPTAVSIKGTGMAQAITVRAADDQLLFTALLRQVSWMPSQPGLPIVPDPAKLGPGFTLTVYTGTTATQVYDLYPLADGGPRAHRPAAQPKSKVAEAWFYADVGMPDALAAAGAPLPRPSASDTEGVLSYGDPVGFVPAVVNSQQPMSLRRTLRSSERTLLLWLVTPFVVTGLLYLAARRARRYGGKMSL